MDFVKIFVSLMILFVAVNLLLTIYRLLNRKWREGLENADDGCDTGSYCQNPLTPGAVCHGTDTPCGANPLASSSSSAPTTTTTPTTTAAAAAAAASNTTCSDKGGLLTESECRSFAQSKGFDVNDKSVYNVTSEGPSSSLWDGCNVATNGKKIWFSSGGIGNVDKEAWKPVCKSDITAAPAAPATPAPVAQAPVAQAPVAQAPVAQAPVAQTPAQVAQAPVQTAPATKAMVCPNGCTAPTELTGNCNSLEKDANGNYYKNCPYECTGDGCQYDQQCSNCGAFKITGLWDKNGNYIGQDESVQKTAASTVAGGTRTAGVTDGTLDDDTAAAYAQAGGSISTPSAVKTAPCDVLAIHNNSAHSSTYGQWFPGQVSKLNLSQTNYEHAGRKFLNEESIKKGIRTPLVMDSEAEVLGRLLWRVHLAAITQNCMKNTPTSVTTTMNDELALMKKVHQIQNSKTESSIAGTACAINTSCQPKQTANCSTTGMLTNCGTGTGTGDNRPGAYAPSTDATNSINSTVPSVSGASTAYSSDYKPRNPNIKPKPYNSIWDIF